MTERDAIARARELIDAAIGARVFPAAVTEIGASAGPLWREAFGTLTFDDGASATTPATVFDLASITKPVATTTLLMDLRAERRVALEETIASIFGEWRGTDRQGVTVRDLLEHCSGLPARLIDPPPDSRREFEHDICALPLEYPPRSRSLYSDLDFILLGFLVVDRGSAPLAAQFDRMSAAWRGVDAAGEAPFLGFNVALSFGASTAPTEPLATDRRRRRLVGEVHDDYASALGGAAGHAGLFANVIGLGQFARLALRGARGDRSVPDVLSPERVALTTQQSAVDRSSRALGWDTMLPTSSCGSGMSPQAFGHVGFTGTSLWIDPTRDRYFVLLTNRACGGGTSDEMQQVRRAFHDALAHI